MKNQRVFLASLFLVLAGCGIYQNKTSGGSIPVDTSALTNPDRIVSYADVRDAVFVSCVECHGATKQKKGVRLDSYPLVISFLGKIKQTAIIDRSMPNADGGGPLTTDQIALLQKWIDQGSPEQGGTKPEGTATPAPTAAPVTSPTATPSPSGSPAIFVTYAMVRDSVFTASCVSCHGPKREEKHVRLDSFAGIIQNLSDVKQDALGDMSMPDTDEAGVLPLTTYQISLLSDWINEGAPETAVSQPSPVPIVTSTPEPTPVLTPTYQSIHDLIFVQKCLKCHTTGGSADQVPLEPYDSMMKVPGLVTPKDIVLSSLVQETKVTPPRTSPSMPPMRSGIPQLTDDELNAVKTWINNGAQP